jgi:hypothetical protein
MGNRQWSAIDIERLRLNYGRVPDALLAGRLDRSVLAVRSKAVKLCIRSPRPFDGSMATPHEHDEMGCRRPRPGCWTVDDVLRLELRYGTEPIATTAKALGRSTNAVKIKASRLGLTADVEEAA